MNRVSLFLLVILLAGFPLCSQEKKVITVLDFSINNVSENDMKSITSFLSAALFDTGVYQVIDASQRNAILQELSFSSSGCVDESCQLEIGKMLSAEMIVVGDIGLLGGRYILTAKLLETETSNTVRTAKGIYQDLGELIDGMYKLASDLSETVAVAQSPETSETEPAETIDETESETVVEEVVPADILETSDQTEESTRPKLGTRKIVGLSCIAGGTIASIVGGFLIYQAIDFYNNELADAQTAYNSDGADVYPGDWSALSQTERQDFYDSLYTNLNDLTDKKNSKIIVSTVTAGGGLALLGTGIFLFLMPDKMEVEIEDVLVSFNMYPEINQTSFSMNVSY